MPELAEAFHVIARTCPVRCQREAAPESFPYGIDAFAEAIADLYAGLELGPAAVVGHALGGAVALTLAARQPRARVQARADRRALLRERHGPATASLRCCRSWAGSYSSSCGARPVPGATFRRPCSARPRTSRLRASIATTRRSTRPTLVAARWPRCEPPSIRAGSSPKPRASKRPRWWFGGATIASGRQASGNALSREIRGSGFELLDSGHSPQEERRARSCASCSASFWTNVAAVSSAPNEPAQFGQRAWLRLLSGHVVCPRVARHPRPQRLRGRPRRGTARAGRGRGSGRSRRHRARQFRHRSAGRAWLSLRRVDRSNSAEPPIALY